MKHTEIKPNSHLNWSFQVSVFKCPWLKNLICSFLFYCIIPRKNGNDKLTILVFSVCLMKGS